ncbi:OmpA family protein [Nocardiopsis coralliicola]
MSAAPGWRSGRTAAVAALAAGVLLAAPPAAAGDEAALMGDPENATGPFDGFIVPIGDTSPFIVGMDPSGSVEPMQSEEIEGSTTTVTIAADVLFAFDEAELDGAAASVLADLAEQLAGAEGTVTVVGHSDGIGADTYNQKLSEERAAAVADALADEMGQGAPEMETEGRGADEPLAEETDSDGSDIPDARAENRRVEVAFESTG